MVTRDAFDEFHVRTMVNILVLLLSFWRKCLVTSAIIGVMSKVEQTKAQAALFFFFHFTLEVCPQVMRLTSLIESWHFSVISNSKKKDSSSHNMLLDFEVHIVYQQCSFCIDVISGCNAISLSR